MMKYLLITVFALTFIVQAHLEPKPSKQIYLLIGQSNMGGRGVITSKIFK